MDSTSPARKLRLVFDVDGVIAEGGYPYWDCSPFPFAVEAIRRLRADGHTIIWQTARYMVRCDGNQQKAIEQGWHELKSWLDKHDIPWNEIYLGKPSGDIYVDDRGFRLESCRGVEGWEQLLTLVGLQNTPRKQEDSGADLPVSM